MKRLYLALLLGLCTATQEVAASSDTVITFNEIMYHPAANEPAMEWVELYNQMSYDMDLSGWRLDDGIDFTFPEGTRIPGRGYLVVASDPVALRTATGLTNVLGPFTSRLSNAGETIELKNNNGRLMDRLSYQAEFDWPVGADGAGPSLAKLNSTSASGEAANWAASAQNGGTPGARNVVAPGSFTPPLGLVSYWDFDQANVAVTDRVGGNHGVPGPGVTPVTGLVGQGALKFDSAADAYVHVGSGVGNNLSVTDGITIEALIRPNWNGTGNAEIFRKEEVTADTLVAYWSFDEASSGAAPALDPVSGNHGTFIGTATRTVGLVGLGAARFNNSGSDGVDAGPGVNQSFSMSAGITVFARMRPTWSGNAGDYDEIFRKEDGDNRILLSFQNDGNYGGANPPVPPGPVLSFGLNVGGSYSELDLPLDGATGRPSLTQLRDGNTHSVAATYDAASGRKAIWINGTMRWSVVLSGAIRSDGGASAVLGNISPAGGEPFSGIIDEVAIWRAALTPGDIAALAAGASPLTVGASVDPEASTRLRLSFQNDGQNANANPPVPAGPVLSFGVNVGGAYTELDMPLDGVNGRPTLEQCTDGQPHHVAATYDRATGWKAIYLDGELRFSHLLAGAITSGGSGPAILGNTAVQGPGPFIGTLDEVAFWNRALTAAEVARHAAATRVGQGYFSEIAIQERPLLAFNELAASTRAPF